MCGGCGVGVGWICWVNRVGEGVIPAGGWVGGGVRIGARNDMMQERAGLGVNLCDGAVRPLPVCRSAGPVVPDRRRRCRVVILSLCFVLPPC